MRLYTIVRPSGEHAVCAEFGEGLLLDLRRADEIRSGAARPQLRCMQALIEAGDAGLDAARTLLLDIAEEAVVKLDGARLLAPLPVPVRLRDSGMFIEHLEPARRAMMRLAFRRHPDPDAAVAAALHNDPGLPEIISRRVLYYNGNHHAVIGPDAVVGWPADSEVLDYELEMAVVVGRAASNIDLQQAKACVFGYTLMNDWSARDIQVDTSRGGVGPCMGKDFATSLGPCIVTADEIGDPHDIALSAWIDGERWSSGSTRNMQHSFPEALSQLSRVSPLVPGEVIGTGTCLGGSAVEQNRRLARGQTVELRADGIGTLRNRIED